MPATIAYIFTLLGLYTIKQLLAKINQKTNEYYFQRH